MFGSNIQGRENRTRQSQQLAEWHQVWPEKRVLQMKLEERGLCDNKRWVILILDSFRKKRSKITERSLKIVENQQKENRQDQDFELRCIVAAMAAMLKRDAMRLSSRPMAALLHNIAIVPLLTTMIRKQIIDHIEGHSIIRARERQRITIEKPLRGTQI